MSLTRYAGDRFAGLSTDVKPGGLFDGADFIETDTLRRYVYIITSGGWVPENFISGTFTSGLLTKNVILCTAFTPTGVGADPAEIPMPYDFDGVTPITWQVTRYTFRVQVTGGSPSVTFEKYTGINAFSATQIDGTLTLNSGVYENYLTGVTGTLNSNDKLRFNVITLGTAQNWTIEVQIKPK